MKRTRACARHRCAQPSRPLSYDRVLPASNGCTAEGGGRKKGKRIIRNIPGDIGGVFFSTLKRPRSRRSGCVHALSKNGIPAREIEVYRRVLFYSCAGQEKTCKEPFRFDGKSVFFLLLNFRDYIHSSRNQVVNDIGDCSVDKTFFPITFRRIHVSAGVVCFSPIYAD